MLSLMEKMRELYNAALQQRQEAWNRITVDHCHGTWMKCTSCKGTGIRKDSPCRKCTQMHPGEITPRPGMVPGDDVHRQGVSISKFDQFKELTALRAADPTWGALASVDMLREPLDRIKKAFDNFFRRCKEGQTPGYPKFKGKGRYTSLAFPPDGAYRLSDRLRVPNVPGTIKTIWHRPYSGTPKLVRIAHKAGQWHAFVVCENCPTPAPLPPTGRNIGVDLGVSCFAAVSDGTFIENPRHLDKAAERLAKAHRRLSKKDARIKRARQRATGAAETPERLTYNERHSKKRQKVVLAIQKTSAETARVRKDFHRKTALTLLRGADVVAVENLQIANMTRSAKGTVDEPGTKVAQKSGLNRAILDAGWGGFLTILENKGEQLGREVVRVAPQGTSQECSGCGATVPKALSVRVHDCPHCGLVLDRDVNAARNIEKRARSK